MVGRGVSLNQISSMWTSFNPPIVMNDEKETIDAQDLEFMENYDDDDDDEEEEDDEENEEENDEQLDSGQFEDQENELESATNIKQEPIDND